jgi:hypothetical protein
MNGHSEKLVKASERPVYRPSGRDAFHSRTMRKPLFRDSALRGRTVLKSLVQLTGYAMACAMLSALQSGSGYRRA